MKQVDREFFESIVGDLNSGMGEAYNRYCCEQGIIIAEALRSKDKIIEFSKMGWGQQKAEVPGLDDGHSGNTFNMACRLAIVYLPQIRDRRIDEVIGQ